jgi:hypothetical protein
MKATRLQAVIEECLLRNLEILIEPERAKHVSAWVENYPLWSDDVRDMLKAAAANLAQGLAAECGYDTPPT